MTPSLSPGWHVSDHALRDLLEETPEDGKKLETLILDLDLKSFGLPSLQDKMDKSAGVVKGPIVLQISRIRDCGRPSLGESSPSNLLRVFLTDGHQAVSAIALEKINGISEDKTPWGTKILLRGEVKLEGQFILLTPSNVTVIGGRVDRLIERWNIEKSSMKGIGRKSGEVAAPKWVSFGRRDNNGEAIKNTKNFKANDVLKGVTEKEEEEGEDQFEKARKEKLEAVEATERKFAKVKVEVPKGGLSEEAKIEQMKEKMKKRGEKEEERREMRGMKGGRRGRRGSDDEPDVPSEFARPSQGITLSSFLGDNVAPLPTTVAPPIYNAMPPPPTYGGRGGGERFDGGARGGRNERGGRGGTNDRGGRGGTNDRGGRGGRGGGRDQERGGYGRDERNGGGERRFDGDGQKRQMDDRKDGGGRGGQTNREERGEGGRGGRNDRAQARGGFNGEGREGRGGFIGESRGGRGGEGRGGMSGRGRGGFEHESRGGIDGGSRGGRGGFESGRGGNRGGRGGGFNSDNGRGGSQSARDGGYGRDERTSVHRGDEGGYGNGRGERRDGGFSGQDARGDRGGRGGERGRGGRGRGGMAPSSNYGGGRQEGMQSSRRETIPSLMSESDFPPVDGLNRGMGGMKIGGGGMYSDEGRGGRGGEVKEGSRVKAPWEDGNFYPATVLHVVSGTMATVRFDGSDHAKTLPLGVLLQ